MIEKAIYNFLSTYAGLSGIIISFGIEDYVSENKEYIVFYRNTTIPYDTKSGRSTLDEAQVQVNCFSKSALGAANLAENVRGALDRKSGIANGVTVQSIQFINQVSLFEFNETYNNKGLYQISQFYQCRVEPQYQ